METVTLEARTRTEIGKGPSRRLRREGLIPSVTYRRGTETVSLSVPREKLRAILRSERGRNTLIQLTVDDGKGYDVMIKDFTVHPITRQLVHADFLQVDASEPIVVAVPFRALGKPAGEILGGTLLQTARTLKLRCLPTAIPDALEYDVSAMEIDDVVRVRDLPLPEGVTALLREDQKLLIVRPPRVEEVAKPEGEEEGAVAPAEGDAKAKEADAAGGDSK